jgi:Phytanoyl-CoA dioxygenase (PhyH)
MIDLDELNVVGHQVVRRGFEPTTLLPLRDAILDVLRRHGAISTETDYRVLEAHYFDSQPKFRLIYREIVKLPELHDVPHLGAVKSLGRQLFGSDVFVHPIVFPRIVFPTPPEFHWTTVTAHQDYPHIGGDQSFVTVWTPLDECPLETGPLSVQCASHLDGVLPSRVALQGGAEASFRPDLKWETYPMSMGDALVFKSHTVHASTRNKSSKVRLSIDFRMQPLGSPVAESVLPSRTYLFDVSIAEIYRRLKDRSKMFYWNRLPMPVDRSRVAPESASFNDASELDTLVATHGMRAFPILLRVAEVHANEAISVRAKELLAENGIRDVLDVRVPSDAR